MKIPHNLALGKKTLVNYYFFWLLFHLLGIKYDIFNVFRNWLPSFWLLPGPW